MYGRQRDKGQEYPPGISYDDELKICGEPVVMTIGELLPMVSPRERNDVKPTDLTIMQSFGPNDMDKREVKTAKFG